MRFHLTHGSAVTLTDDRHGATRDDASFCNGIVFGHQPLKVNQKICLELKCSSAWSGALRLGVTTHDPAHLTRDDLPKYAYPDLTRKEGYWARAVPEKLVCTGCCVMVYVTGSGQMQVFVDGQHKGVLLAKLPISQPLWLLVDIYGNTKGVQFIKPDEAPREIIARGLEAVQAYDQSCSSGTQPVYRTRLMLVGKDRVGKTSLKRALTGQQHNEAEESTDGIDLSASCSFHLSNRSSWKLALKGDVTAREERQQERLDLGIIGGAEGLEEEYNQAIAANIVHELLYKQRQRDKMADTSTTAATSSSHSYPPSTNTSATSYKSSRPGSTRVNSSTSLSRTSRTTPESRRGITTPRPGPTSRNTSQSSLQDDLHDSMPKISPEVPERVVSLVQEMLNTMASRKISDAATEDSGSSLPEKPKTVVLNIWDFAGQAVYYTTHQVFLTHRAVYVIVFNVCDSLMPTESDSSDGDSEELSTLEYMDFWMRSIHAHAAENMSENVDNTTLSPPIFVVGTHRNCLHDDPDVRAEMVEEKFSDLRDYLTGKPYTQHLVTPFFAVESSLNGDEQIGLLRAEIERVAGQQPYMGEQMPIRWLRFEQEITHKADTGTHCALLSQVEEMARNHGVNSDEELHTMLTFYHDLGLLIHYGASADGTTSPDTLLANTVVLSPQWLAQTFRRVVTGSRPSDQWKLHADKWDRLEHHGILDETLISQLWPDAVDQKAVLLGLMEKLDLLCPLVHSPAQGQGEEGQSYVVPMRLGPCKDLDRIYVPTSEDVVFYLHFNGFLPDGLFFRILNRTLVWSQERGGRDQCLCQRVARFYLDADHDVVLHMALKQLHRAKVVVMYVGEQEATSSKRKGNPSPAACAQVRNFLESTLADLRHLWMKRIAYHLCVVCPCERVCERHKMEACEEEACLHFLNLDECRVNKVVCCEHRRVKTEEFQSWFPRPETPGFQSPIVPGVKIEETYGNIERHVQGLPDWMKGAAKLLNSGDLNQDWLALAGLLGYKASRIERLTEDVNPALALLTDWVVSNGNTSMAVDLLILCLQQLGRSDIMQIIERAKESSSPVPQVFLSYQWESQDQVQAIRDHLERLGYACWMDIGQMGGGDMLNAKIEEGLRSCKVVVACVSPRYVASQLCTRELCLADLLQRPIVPVMLHPIPWPPPGAMALILSQHVYINMKGVGGHGGTGIHADLQDKYAEIVQRVALHATPFLTPYISISTTGMHRNYHQHQQQLLDMPQQSANMPDNFVLRRTSTGSLSDDSPRNFSGNRSEPSMDVLLSRISETDSAILSRQGGQVHVTKCAVCVIL